MKLCHHRLMAHGLMVLLLACTAALPQAETLHARGHSVITGDLHTARSNALNDAIRQAVIQSGSHVQSHTLVKNGQVTHDTMQLQGNAELRNIRVLKESHDGQIYTVAIAADTHRENDNQCNSQQYHKSVLLTGFNRERPQSANVGALDNAGTALPEELARRLYPAYNTLVQTQTDLQLTSNARLMQNYFEQHHSIQHAASRFQTQYVISGSIVDMSMLNANAYYRQNRLTRSGNHMASTVKDWVGMNPNDIRARNFALRVVLHDGVSGEPLYDKTYQIQGLWDARYTENTGFASARFWQTHYGRAVHRLLDEIVDDLGEKITCQPFMAPLKLDRNDPAGYIMAGSNNGLKVGDTLQVFSQTAAPFSHRHGTASAYQMANNIQQLRQAEAEIVITQTYPTYSLGSFTKPLTPHGQYLVMAP